MSESFEYSILPFLDQIDPTKSTVGEENYDKRLIEIDNVFKDKSLYAIFGRKRPARVTDTQLENLWTLPKRLPKVWPK